MGLDMYLSGDVYIGHDQRSLMFDGLQIKECKVELGYWRKHPNLRGYIVQTFADGLDECQNIPLDEESLENIIQAIKGKNLPETKGFFFGSSDGSKDQESIEIFEKALKWLAVQGKGYRSVVYRASW